MERFTSIECHLSAQGLYSVLTCAASGPLSLFTSVPKHNPGHCLPSVFRNLDLFCLQQFFSLALPCLTLAVFRGLRQLFHRMFIGVCFLTVGFCILIWGRHAIAEALCCLYVAARRAWQHFVHCDDANLF